MRGKIIVTKLVWVMTSFVSCDESNFWLMKLQEGFKTMKFLLEDLSLGPSGEFRDGLSLYWLFVKCLQLKVINIPKRLNSYSHVWDGMFHYQSTRESQVIRTEPHLMCLPESPSRPCLRSPFPQSLTIDPDQVP